jgi:hypothetical protein
VELALRDKVLQEQKQLTMMPVAAAGQVRQEILMVLDTAVTESKV